MYGSFARSIGKNLASLVVGASTLIGASNVNAEEIIPFNSITNVSPYYAPSTAHYVCTNVTFNNRVTKNKIILFYKFRSLSGNDYLIGGLTVPANSSQTVFEESYLRGKKSPTVVGLSPGEVATNGLNGASEWFAGVDEDNSGTVAGVGVNSSNLYFEPGEYRNSTQISFPEGIPPFPSDKTSTVYIARINIKGYQDTFPTNGIPDYFEAKYNLPMNTTTNSNFDGDSQTDFQEWVAGTDPTNAASYFGVKSFDNGTNTFALNIGNTLEGRVYGVKATTNLADSASWTNAIPEVAGNGTNTLYIAKDPMKQQEFYKPYVNLSTNEVVNP